MAPTNDQVSFDSIIKRSRERKKDEALANQILGSGRRKSAPTGPSNRKASGTAGSLASRVGVTKVVSYSSQRSSTAVPKPSINSTRWGHDLHHVNNPKGARFAKPARTHSAPRLETRSQSFNGGFKTAAAPKPTDNINIRGRAAPQFSTVVASNFAPGTTAADIEAVMGNVGGEMVSCKLTSARPTVIAEMQFAERAGAENVIATFNNRKADGRLLYVYMKDDTPITQSAPRKLYEPADEAMEVDNEPGNYRQSRSTRRAEPDYQDGRYGFVDTTGDYGREDRWDEQRLYSDDIRRGDRNYRR
ncbi:uncharacterized protein J3D65DRAFT_694440 [Phyllosticta citribraziliensis]|uniref:RRM domain-containing protein n=1 Tax=Phyllosticta citribraziliensis TaxID=989973 RepID=A0ABR1LU09_9PEZI